MPFCFPLAAIAANPLRWFPAAEATAPWPLRTADTMLTDSWQKPSWLLKKQRGQALPNVFFKAVSLR